MIVLGLTAVSLLPFDDRLAIHTQGRVWDRFQSGWVNRLAANARRYHTPLVAPVAVLGDAEFSNEPVINGLIPKNWGFVFHFQSNYRVQLEPDGPWLAAQSIYEAVGLKPGQVKHWSIVPLPKPIKFLT